MKIYSQELTRTTSRWNHGITEETPTNFGVRVFKRTQGEEMLVLFPATEFVPRATLLIRSDGGNQITWLEATEELIRGVPNFPEIHPAVVELKLFLHDS